MQVKRLFLLSSLTLLIGTFSGKGQNTDSRVKWTLKDATSQRVFVENRGQFTAPAKENEAAILYAFDEGGQKIYFTTKGIIYSFTEKKLKNKKNANTFSARSEEEEEAKGNLEVKSDLVTMTWLGANPNVSVEADDITPDYYSYTLKEKDGEWKNVNYIKAYKKLVYKNLYPGIDVVYTFHEGEGIEYSLILHPGADISLVKMKYSDNYEASIWNGKVNIVMSVGNIVDNTPETFYSSDKSDAIVSSFKKVDNTIMFELGDYDHSKEITIDPWTITPAFSNSNRIWNCQTDGSGNVYLYGGDSPLTLKKFTSGGTLIWTYNTPWDSSTYWLGTLVTDKAGNSYVTSGSNGEVSKVSSAGALVWHNNPNGGFGPVYEYWHEALNCDQTQLVIGGMYGAVSPSQGAIMNINLTNGAIANKIIVGEMSGLSIDECRSICFSPNGNFYFMTLDSIGSLNAALTTYGFKSNSTYNFSYGSPSYSIVGNLGLNAMKATKSFIYTVNGANVAKRSIGNGAILATAAIPGGSASSSLGTNSPNNNGIDIDSCGNVYVGSGNSVTEFDANLTKITSTTTPSTVYDVAVNNNGEVIACGNNFAMSINFSACLPPAPICHLCTNPTISKSSTNNLCNGASTGTASVTAGGGGPYYYSWSPNTTDTTSSASGLAAGIYTITVTNSGGCSLTDTVKITQPTVITGNVSTAPSCSGNNGTATVVAGGGTGPYKYSWAPSGGTNATATGLAAGSYTVTITDKLGCTKTETATVSSSTGSSPTVVMSNTNASCSACNGTATATPSPSGTYNYVWSNGDTTQTISNLCSGSYTVTVTATGTTTSTFYTEDFTTGGTGWTLNTLGSGTNGPNANAWIVDNKSALCNAGNYLHVECTGSHPPFYTCTSGAHYDPGNPIFDNSATDKYAYSPVVSTVGATNMTLTFTYQCNGASGSDYGVVSLYNGTTWTDLPTQYSGVTSCTKASIPIPAAYNGLSNFQYGFRWINSNTGAGTDAPFAIDSIAITGTVKAAGCPTVETINLTSTGSFSLTTTPTSTTCGSNNGSATANPVPAGAYTYKWSDGQTTQTATGLAAGTYTVIATSGGCSDTTTVTISSTGGPSATSTITNPLCNGGTGTAVANASGGTGPYTYSWAPSGGTNATATGLTAGTYTCTVTDSKGCSTLDTVKVTQPGAITGSITPTSATCGNSNGSAVITATGGTGSLTYSWSPSGGTNAIASGLAAGSYTCTVTDANGCTHTINTTISNAGGPTVTSTLTNPLCNGGTGSATANASGGSSPYTYSWSPSGGTNATASGLSAGTYICTVTDKNGCTSTDTVTVVVPVAITGSVTGTTSASCGSSNGSATISASGGTGALTYSWAPSGGTNSTANNLAAGTYTCTVTDANGCTKTITAAISNTGGPSVTSVSTNPLCNGGTGSATVTASGGTGPYTYSWSPSGGTNATATGLTAGTYTCTVTDASGCITNDTVVVTQPLAITGSAAITNATCGNSDGGATVTASGGTGALTYNWSPSGGASATASNLAAGSYTCTVTDANGCSHQVIASVSNIGAPTVTSSDMNEQCFGGSTGSATVNATGGTGPYTYSWAPSGGTNATATGLPVGTYTCTVTDSKGCITIDTVTVNQPTDIKSTITAVNAMCGKPGSASVTASGGTGPYTYSWSPSGGTNTTAANLTAGTYSCTVTDANGCSNTQTTTITGSSGPKATITSDTTIEVGDSAKIAATGGGTYLWIPATGLSCTNCPNPTATPSVTTQYCVLVTDTSGCSDSLCTTVTIDYPCGTIYVPTAFSPNGDRENDLECVYGGCVKVIDFVIYDRWGNKVFETNDPNNVCWDGKYKGTLMNTGVFVYYLQVEQSNGNKVTQKGNITLVR